MKKLTAMIITGCLLSGTAFFTSNPVSGQAVKEPDANAKKDKAAAPEKDSKQPPRNFDPQKMKQAFMDNIKETLCVTDEEWNVLLPKIEKVITMSRETAMQGRMGFGPGGRRGGPQGSGEISKAIQALEEILDSSKSTPEDITAGLNAVREARKKAEQELAKAKTELLEAATPRQQGRLIVLGIID
ncbi:MAG TPA: hypothetical protein DET40_10210 [Lentisphaeria bacterium]|nr:MAG: hypothetical protein A2X45_10070 [Lentisphaerae bacterium GWF2_50_93]HCE43909.1 hypothetical protein [Lentisphaeria bacterium]